MALRLYATRNAVANATTGQTATLGAWWNSPTQACFELSLDKADQVLNGGAQNSAVTPSGANDGQKMYLASYVYELPEALSLSGTIDLCFPTSGFGGDPATYDLHWCVHAWVKAGVAGGVRGTLLSNYSEPTGSGNLLASSPAYASQLADPAGLTTVAALAADFLIIEVGCVQWEPASDTQPSIYTGTRNNSGTVLADMAAGDPGVDGFGNMQGATWIEFALIPAPIPQPDACPPCTSDPGTEPDPIGDLPPWTPMCDGGGLVESLADLADGEDWAA